MSYHRLHHFLTATPWSSSEVNERWLQLPSNLQFTDEEFAQIVAVNKELRLELTAEGELIIMSPTGDDFCIND